MKNTFRLLAVLAIAICGSRDARAQWVQTSTPPSGLVYVVMAAGGNVYAGTGSGGVFRTGDYGATWKDVSVPGTSSYVDAFTVTTDTVWLGMAAPSIGGIIFYSTNTGANWTGSNNGIPTTSVYAIINSNDTLFAGCDPGVGVYRSTDHGATWSRVRSFQCSSFAILGRYLFAGDCNGGVWRSPDNGATWTSQSTGISVSGIYVLTSFGGNVFAGTGSGGVFVTTDSGATWSGANGGNPGLMSNYVHAMIASGNELFAATATSVFHTTNNGTSWTDISSGLGTLNTKVWSFTSDGQYLYAATSGGVWRLGIVKAPIIGSQTSATLTPLVCDSTQKDTVMVHNTGNDTLKISSATFLGASAGEFTLVNPASFPVSIAPGDSIRVIIQLTSSVLGQKLDTLSLANNDPAAGHNPWRVILSARKERIALAVSDTVRIDSVHAGVPKDTLVVFRTTGTLPDTISAVTRDSGVAWITYRSPLLPRTVLATAPNDTAQLRFHVVAPHDTGWFSARFRVHVEPCGVDSFLTVRVYCVSGITRVVSTLAEDSLLCGLQACTTYMVHNTGNGPLTIDSLAPRGTDAKDFGPTAPATPRTIAAHDSMVFTVCFTPLFAGSKIATLCVFSDDSVSAIMPAVTTISGRKDSADFQLSPGVLDLGDVCVGMRYCDHISAANTGTVEDTITRVTFTAGSGAFACTSPTQPLPVAVAGAGPITVCFTPPDTGTFTATFTVYGEPCDRVHQFTVRGRGVNVSVVPTASLVQWGDVRTGSCRDSEMIFVVSGYGTLSLMSCSLLLGDPAFAIVSVQPSLPRMVNAGDTLRVRVKYCPTSEVRDSQFVQFNAVAPCALLPIAGVTGRGVSSAILMNKTVMAMDSSPCGGPPMVDTVSLTNTGSVDLHISCTIDGADALNFALDPPSSFVVPPSITARVVVHAYPPAPGTWRALLVIASDDAKRPRDTVALSARRDTAALVSTPRSLNFGDLPSCLLPKDTLVVLCNSGTVPDTVTASAPVNVRVISALPRHIAPGACDTVIVRFSPATFNADVREDLVFTSVPCMITDTVHVRGRADEYTFVPDTLAFGNTQVGNSVCLPVSIVNANSRAVHIARIVITPATTELLGHGLTFPLTIPAHDSVVDTVCYTPADSTPLAAVLLAFVDVPCADTIACTLRGHGIKSDLIVRPRPLDFGVLDLCTVAVDSVELCDRGTAPIAIGSLALGGADAAIFALVNAPAFPMTLAPGECRWITISCDTAARGEGSWRAVLTITPQDLSLPAQTVDLLVTRGAPVLAVPAAIDFGALAVGSTRDTTIVLHNTGTLAVCIDTIVAPPAFAILTPALRRTLAPGDSLVFRVRFAPTADTDDRGAFDVVLSCPCPEHLQIALFGQGISGGVCVAAMALAADTLSANTGDAVTVPLRITTSSGLNACGIMHIHGRFRYNRSVLMNTDALPFTDSSDNRTRTLTLDLVRTDTTGALAALHFIATLGDTDRTALHLDAFSSTDGPVALSTADGFFTLANVCTQGGARFFASSGTLALAQNAPNPFTAATTIAFSTDEIGPTRLVVQDVLGRTVAVLCDEVLVPGHYQRTLAPGALHAGMYLATLVTASQRLSITMLKCQ